MIGSCVTLGGFPSSDLKIVHFLDVTYSQSNNSYKSFSKSNVIPSYINVNPNPNPAASIVKQILDAINIRINRLSSSKNIFHNNNKKDS